ncbi:MAG: OmpA family protein [candidate division WOR-3 bacterium]|nr:OmpA family protein [candidate division WOR-3 bacterium]MDH5683585.1 OmpA family protein [candidate division WOR-3 bacterium]
MKKLLVMVILLTLFLIPSITIGLPSLAGNRGLFRVQDARVEGSGLLSVSGHLLGTWDKPNDTLTNYFVDLIFPSLGYAPTDFIEFYAGWGGLFQYVNEKSDFGFHDKVVGGKLSIPWIPVLKLGGTGYYTFKRDSGFSNPSMPMREKLAWNGLLTVELSEFLPSAPNFIFNYGQSKYNDQDITSAGLGFELAAKNLSLLIEATSDQLDPDSSLFSKNAFMRITPGLRFKGGGVGVDFGLSLGLTDTVPDYEIIFGLNFVTPFLQPPKPALGTIAGKISDSRTGEPLLATINFPEHPRLKPFTSDPNTGVFTAEKVPAGVVVVEVSKDGYLKEAMPITVKADGIVSYEFKLKPLVTYGVVAGKVYDLTDNRPLKALISFPNTSIQPINSDSATGTFRVDNVPVGIISVQAEKDGYFKNALTVQVEEGKVASAQLGLAPSAFRATLTGKVADKKTDAPLKATLSFPDAGVSDVASDSATGIYKTQLPVGSHPVEVKAEGYITQTAVVILEKDKITEKNFDLIQKGMVITLKGVYFDFDKATIRPESYPVLDDAAKILKDNPKIMVEIQGHTDYQGSDSYNQTLSDKRAYSVVQYLVKTHGIEIKRLKAVGYGESKPIASNETLEGRALNRRVEFVILGEME